VKVLSWAGMHDGRMHTIRTIINFIIPSLS
jgi:hypothetical protein